jgi:hypothetical protein
VWCTGLQRAYEGVRPRQGQHKEMPNFRGSFAENGGHGAVMRRPLRALWRVPVGWDMRTCERCARGEGGVLCERNRGVWEQTTLVWR